MAVGPEGAASGPGRATGDRWTQEPLFVFPQGEVPQLVEVVDQSGDHWLVVTRSRSGDRVVLDGRVFGPYPHVYCEWSRDEQSGDPLPPPLALAARGATAAWSVDDADGMRVVVDGERGPWVEGVSVQSPPVFSPDGGHLAYGAMTSPPDGRFRARSTADLVVDGVRRGILLGRAPVQFAPDGRLCFVEAGDDGRERVVVDGTAGPWVEAVLPLGPQGVYPTPARRPMDPVIFAPGGGSFAYVARVGGGVAVVRDHDIGAVHCDVGVPVFSASGARLAYTASRQQRRHLRRVRHDFLVVDDVNGPEFAFVEAQVTFDADERVMYLAAPAGDRFELFCDHRRVGGSWPLLGGGLHRTPSGRVWFVAGEEPGASQMIVDGEVQWSSASSTGTPNPAVTVVETTVNESPDGRRLGYLVGPPAGFTEGGARRLVLDGAVVGDLDADDRFWGRGQGFSPDSRTAAIAVRAVGGMRPWVEGEPLGVPAEDWAGPWWSRGRVRFFAVVGSQLIRSQLTVVGATDEDRGRTS